MPEKVGDMRFEIYKMWVMVRLAWRIVQALKNARGSSRISEIGEWVLYVIETNKQVSPTKSVCYPNLRMVLYSNDFAGSDTASHIGLFTYLPSPFNVASQQDKRKVYTFD